jgi:hypothetical protein
MRLRISAHNAATIRDGIEAGRQIARRDVSYDDSVFYINWAAEDRVLWRRAAMRAYIQTRREPVWPAHIGPWWHQSGDRS